MKNYYKIVSIEHSGRKDIRGKPVDDNEYFGLLGAKVDIGNLLQNVIDAEHLHMWYIARFYIKSGARTGEMWNTSKVLGLTRTLDGNIAIEIANTIYTLIPI